MTAKTESKSERLDVRLTRQHKRLIERAAIVTGQPVTSFVLTSVLERAREALETDARTVLSDSDRVAFLALLDRPARPVPTLVRAASRAPSLDG